MNKLALIIFAVLLAGCSHPQQHVWDELDRCKALFEEECTVVVVPNSKAAYMQHIASMWRHAAKGAAK